MIFNNEQIQEILSLVDFRFADLVWKIFGPSHLTSQDKENLKKHGIDPGSLVKKIPPYWANWMFGLLSGKLSDYQTKQISYKDLLDYLARRQYETPSKREIEEYEMACNRTYGYLKGLGDKMKKDISSYISDSELRMRMEQERTIKEGVKRGIVERDTTKLIAAKISNQLNDWSRDWNRIVETEYQGVFNMGRVQSYMREGDGSNTLIYFDVYPAACRHCIRLYLTAGIGSEPKLFTAEELIGNGTNIGRRVADWKPTIITAVHPFCYDDKVEVLTNKGWKFFKDLDKTELFLSINPETGEGEYVPAVAWINQYYEGDMVYRKSKCFDLANTPNHVHVGRKHGQKHISLVNESDIKDNFSFLSHIPSWKGIDTPFIVIDNKKYDTNLFCEFLGYYLSEGSFTEWGDKNRTILRRRVNISQKKSEAKEKIIKCCRALFKNVIVTKERIEFNLNKENDKDLIHIIRSFGHAHEKYVPDFIKELSPKYIKIFLDAFLLGDGTVHRGVLYDGYQCKPQRIYSTSSVKLKDDLGELLLKVGKCPSFKNRGKSIYHCKKQKKDYLARYDQWNVAELNSKYRYEKVMKKEIKPYKGFIYDVELEKNHTLVVRRNDNVCVSGNCRCLARRYMKGDVWDKETRSFKQPIDYKRKTAPGAKVKIIVGDKVFYT
jgi:intein/homing endonuclease